MIVINRSTLQTSAIGTVSAIITARFHSTLIASTEKIVEIASNAMKLRIPLHSAATSQLKYPCGSTSFVPVRTTSIPNTSPVTNAVAFAAHIRNGSVSPCANVPPIGTQNAKMKNGKKVAFNVSHPHTSPVNPHAPKKNAAMDNRGCCTTNPATCNPSASPNAARPGHHTPAAVFTSRSRRNHNTHNTTHGISFP